MSKIEMPTLLSSEDLCLEEMKERLNVSADQVLRLEQEGALFSYRREKRGEERLYPLYQLAREIDPDLLTRARELLSSDGALLHQFFTESDPDLAGLCVREVLAGQAFKAHSLDEEAAWLLSQPIARRMEAVQGALQRLHASMLGW